MRKIQSLLTITFLLLLASELERTPPAAAAPHDSPRKLNYSFRAAPYFAK